MVHMRASQMIEFVDGSRVEVEFGVADNVLPELEAGEFAFIVCVAVGPVEGFKLIVRKAGDAEHGVMRFDARLSSENHSIIEDDGAQRQGSSYECAVYGVDGASSIVKDETGIREKGTERNGRKPR